MKFFSHSLIYFLICWNACAQPHEGLGDSHHQEHDSHQSPHHHCRGHLAQVSAAHSPKDAWIKSRDYLPKHLRVRWESVVDKFEIEADSQNTVATLILAQYPQALKKVESMRKILFEKPGSSQDQITSDQIYLENIFTIVWATLTIHTHEILTASKSKKTDFPRYFKILKVITEFDETAPVFSFYKIKRAVEGRFSIQEYRDCL